MGENIVKKGIECKHILSYKYVITEYRDYRMLPRFQDHQELFDIKNVFVLNKYNTNNRKSYDNSYLQLDLIV